MSSTTSCGNSSPPCKVRRIARVPLIRDPGVQFDYGYGTDFLARVLEVVSGQPFEQVLNERVLGLEEFDATLLPVGDGVLVGVRR